jgi:hypothetical protein
MKRAVALALVAAPFLFAAAAFAAVNPFNGCVEQSSTDGRYGFVWKPTGAHRPEAVLVLASRYVLQTASVELFTPAPKRKFIESLALKSTGVCVPGLECLNRPTFSAQFSGATYNRKYGPIVIRVITKTRNCFLYLIRRPDLRSD